MEIIDLTYTLSEEMLVYPGTTRFSKSRMANYEQGYRVDDISLSAGSGTHLDSPSHFCKGGRTIDELPLSDCHGPACVLHLKERVADNPHYAISVDDILAWEETNGKIPQDAFVLADTGWGRFWNKERFCGEDAQGVAHFPGFSKEAAEVLAERKVKCVGIDTISIDTGDSTEFGAHKTLLPLGILLVENMANLDKLPATGAHVWIVPIKIGGAPEAPARAFAVL